MRMLFTGSFDPVTNGHLDLIERLVALAESVVIAVAMNSSKTPLFSVDERVRMLRECCHRWPTVEVMHFDGLVVNAVSVVGADVIVRGIRFAAEYDHEIQMALANRRLRNVETLLLPARSELTFITSSLVKEIARFGGDVSDFVPPIVAERLRQRFTETHAGGAE